MKIQGLILKDEDGMYSLWTEHGIPDDVQEVIMSLVEPFTNEGGSTSPCDTIGELLHETCIRINLKPLYDGGGNYFLHFGGKIIQSQKNGKDFYGLYTDDSEGDLMDYDFVMQTGGKEHLLLSDGEEVIVFKKTAEHVLLMSVNTGRKAWLTPEEFALTLEKAGGTAGGTD